MGGESVRRRGLGQVLGWLTALALALGVWCGGAGSADAIGLLIPSDPELPPLAVKSHRVTIDVTDRAAVTRVEQEFINHTDRQLEATFVFAVPPGATVSDFALWINGVKTPGTVMEKEKARAIYEGIVRRAQDPGLIEYMDGTLFQARIFPVPARGTQKVEISFASVMEQTGNMRHLIYPLKTGRAAMRLLEDFTLVARISSRAPLQAIYSPSHHIAVSRKDDHHATVSFEKSGADLERDFDLYVGTGEDDVGLSLLTWDKDGAGGEDGYFLMVLSPRSEIQEAQLPSKTVTFVVDTSGSMIGEKMDQARKAVKASLQKLRPTDHFNVVRFSTDVESLFGAPMPATPERVREGLAFAERMEAAGGTAIDDALQEALRHEIRGEPHIVIFMTDGRPTVGQTDVPAILKGASQRNAGRARIFAFGVGYDVNTTLLDQLSAEHGGSPDYVRPQEDIEVKVASLYNKVAYPVLADLNIDYGGAGVYDVYPRRLPDLFRGEQVVVLGRTRKGLPPTLRLSGRAGAQQLTFAFEETGAGNPEAATRAHDFIPKVWATRKVGYLLTEIRAKGEVPELKDEVIRLARQYGLVTPYTSFLAVDDSELQNNPPPPPRRDRWEEDRRVNRPGRPIDALQGGKGGAAGGGRRQPAAQNAPWGGEAPAEAEAAPAPVVIRERALNDAKKLKADTGKDAVETSLATKNLQEAKTEGDAAASGTRHVDGRLFVRRGGVWSQDGLDPAKATRIKYLSKAWFALAAAHPELKATLALGDKVLLQVGKRTVLIGAEGVETFAW